MRLKKLIAAIAVAGLVGLASKAWAATTDSMTVTVSVGGSLDILIDTTGDKSYEFGIVGVGLTTVSTRTIRVRNDSASLTEDWQLNCSTFATSGTGVDWNITTSLPSSNEFRMSAQLATAQPIPADANWDYLDNLTAYQNMTTADFGTGAEGANTNGDDVPASNTRDIWFKLETPSSSSDNDVKSITVTVQAASAGTF